MCIVVGVILWISYSWVSVVLGVLRGVIKDLVEYFYVSLSKVYMIYNFYNIDDIRVVSKEMLSIFLFLCFIVSVGRLMEVKNFKYFINVYFNLFECDLLCILGEGE